MATNIGICGGATEGPAESELFSSSSSSLSSNGESGGAALCSREKMDRASPDLWPEQIPGVSDFVALTSPLSNCSSPRTAADHEWSKDLEQEDYNTLQGFGSLTASALLEKVKDLQNLAYQLGLEEAREMNRGRLLCILERSTTQRRR